MIEIKPGTKMGGRTVLRVMNLPDGRKPKFDPATEMIWEFPARPGLWAVCTQEIDLGELPAMIEVMQEIVDSEDVSDLEGAKLLLDQLKEDLSDRTAPWRGEPSEATE